VVRSTTVGRFPVHHTNHSNLLIVQVRQAVARYWRHLQVSDLLDDDRLRSQVVEDSLHTLRPVLLGK